MLPIFTLDKYPSMRTWLCMQDCRHKYYSVVVLVAVTSKMLMVVRINTGHMLNGCGHARSPLHVLVQSLNGVYYRKCEKNTHNTCLLKITTENNENLSILCSPCLIQICQHPALSGAI